MNQLLVPLLVALIILFINLRIHSSRQKNDERRKVVDEVVKAFLGFSSRDVPLDERGFGHAGAARLITQQEMLLARDHIQQHGRGDPLKWALKELDTSELVSFFKWQAKEGYEHKDYQNPAYFHEHVEKFRDSQRAANKSVERDALNARSSR
jgi:hypothetical protein